ncbi:unnamed protein product [Ilex paraguariensis]|uniref:DYW domain-containing protein n=1 Tax=Ilex paraguariensis TaxID=185542 RepID=A0ABC8U3S9_9AQUA
MSRKRASLLTIKSLFALPKVCNPHFFLSSHRIVAYVRLLSTAAERSFFQNPNGSNGENCVEYPQNNSGFHGNNAINVEYQSQSDGHDRDWVYRGNNGEYQQNPDGFYGGNSVGDGQNPSGIYGQNPGNEFQQNLVGQSGKSYNADYKVSHVSEFQRNPIMQNGNFSSGYVREGIRNDFWNNPGGQNGNFNGYNGENSGEMWRNSNLFNTERTRTLQQRSNGLYRENVNLQDQNGFNRVGSVEVPQNPNGQSALESQGSVNRNFGGSTDSFQNVQGNHYGGKTGTYHQNPSGFYGENAGTSKNGFTGEKVGGYQQNTIGISHANGGHYGMGPQVFNNSIPDGESVEAGESNQLRGTIEEFDDFCKEGKLKEAIEVLSLLEQQCIPVDMPRYLILMRACGESKALKEAKSVHEHLMKSVPYPEVSTYNKILEMYCKCGSMDDAGMVFHKMPQRNLTSWDTMIMWLANNGLGEDAIDLFTQFKNSGLKPDGEMFFGVFSACTVLGDITEGLLHFESMTKDYNIVPSMKHYGSIVDMLGSTGYLDEALEFIEKMPMEPSVDVWEALMNLCRVHGNMELGDRCAEFVELLDCSRLNEQSTAGLIPVKASDLAKEKERKKLAGQNLLEVRSRVHEYRAGDTSHPDNDKIYALLRGMKQQMKEAGYVPETKFVLHDIDQEGKEEALLAHSERLAVAQGLLSSAARSPLRIIKNLRVCGDCHSALKIISKLVGRELIIRDAKRFHHFKDGLCSCRDYW